MTVSLYAALAVRKALEDELLGGEADVETLFDPTTELVRRIRDGARPDVVIAVTGALDTLADEGLIVPSSMVRIGTIGMGVAVAAGAAQPDISTDEAFAAALRNARSVAYSQAGASGIYLRELLARLGILEPVAARATVLAKGFMAHAVVDGRADLAIQQLSELAYVPGVDVVGPLPSGMQNLTEFTIGVGAHADAAARALAGRLVDERARRAYRATGFDA